MDAYDTRAVLLILHVIGACVLVGTGAGIAFFMLIAHRTGVPRIVAQTASTVVLADAVFTAPAVVTQMLTGLALAHRSGYLGEGWVTLSLALYGVIGAFWLPVLWIQARMQRLAAEADAAGAPLPERYHKLFRIWFLCGLPAFASIMVIVALMVGKPNLELNL